MRIRWTCLLALIVLSSPTWAVPTTPEQAREAVNTWLAGESAPLGSELGRTAQDVRTFSDSRGEPAYYVVRLDPEGFAVVSGDDQVEPIIAFSSHGEYDPSPANPLGALVEGDLRARVHGVRSMGAEISSVDEAAKQKWALLAGGRGGENGILKLVGAPTGPRVTPLLQTTWSQETAGGLACYNYYVPPFAAGAPGNYPCGCVATTMAQVMRYYSYPATGVGTKSFAIRVDGVSQNRTLRGGDGSGGPYNYADMVASPGFGTPLAQRQAIGALCHDAGLAVQMDYTASASSASLAAAASAMVSTFAFGSAVFGYNSGYSIGTGLNGMINPNLDAGQPVLLGLKGTGIGHAVVCDGYGYSLATLYHHLNMGWAGLDDAWYNLPTIDASADSFSQIDQCVYNLRATGSGEIISGRVTDKAGLAVNGASVTATRAGGTTYTAATNGNGIYALTGLPSDTSFSITAQSTDDVFAARTAGTGASANYNATPGNTWAVDFTGQPNWHCSPDIPKSITDNAVSGVESSLTIEDGRNIADLDIALSIDHTRDSDLKAYLVGPDGTTVSLFSNVGATGDNFVNTIFDDEAATAIAAGVAPFAGSYRPASPLSAFDGKPANGTWKLKVVDGTLGIPGTIESWCLRFSLAADTTPPSCSITGPTSPTSTSPIVFMITFSEPVSALTADRINVTGGTKSGLTGSAASYSLPVNPTGYGQVTCQIAAGAVTDAAANPNTASNLCSVTYQRPGPEVVITSPNEGVNCSRNRAVVDIAGTAGVAGTLASVTWSNDRGGSGACIGTASWTVSGIALQTGANVISVTATNTDGGVGTASIMLTYIDSKPGSAWTNVAMVSLPIAPDSTDPKPVVGFNANGWYAYDSALGQYADYTDHRSWFEPVRSTPGRGFWAYFSGPAAVPVGTLRPQDRPISIHLLPGWNLIGQPFVKPVTWDISKIAVQLRLGDTPQPLAGSRSLTEDYAWGWDAVNSKYYVVYDKSIAPDAVNQLQPWQAYWVKAINECDLILPPP